MPPIFKALATIMAWMLWIVAIIMGWGTFAYGIVRGDLFSTDVPPPMVIPALWAVSCFYAIAAIVIMILRKKME